MTILLRKSTDLPCPQAYDDWFAVTGTDVALDPSRKLSNLAERLEGAFVAERQTWWTLGRELSAEPSADIAHMPTAGSVGSDFGVMLAWGRLVSGLGGEDAVTLVLCDDPWLFRHLAALEGVDAGAPPGLVYSSLKLILRGVLHLNVPLSVNRNVWKLFGNWLERIHRIWPKSSCYRKSEVREIPSDCSQ